MYNADVLPEVTLSEEGTVDILLDGRHYSDGKITSEGEHTLVINGLDFPGNPATGRVIDIKLLTILGIALLFIGINIELYSKINNTRKRLSL